MKPLQLLLLISALLSTAFGLKCFTCWSVNPGNCNQVWSCPAHYDRCATTIVAENLVSKECMRRDMCDRVYSVGVRCCGEDFCNGTSHTGIHLPLLLVPLITVITLFL